jgi:Spy/CpxP family protein refolding chaperone
MNKIKLTMVTVAIVVLATNAAYAQMQGKWQERMQQHKETIYKELNLTAEQQAKLAQNRKVQHENTMKLRAALKEKEAKLREELKAPGVTRAIIQPLVDEIKSLQAQLIDNRVSGIFAVKEILTPEQFAKFQGMMAKQQKNKKMRMETLKQNRQCLQKIPLAN